MASISFETLFVFRFFNCFGQPLLLRKLCHKETTPACSFEDSFWKASKVQHACRASSSAIHDVHRLAELLARSLEAITASSTTAVGHHAADQLLGGPDAAHGARGHGSHKTAERLCDATLRVLVRLDSDVLQSLCKFVQLSPTAWAAANVHQCHVHKTTSVLTVALGTNCSQQLTKL